MKMEEDEDVLFQISTLNLKTILMNQFLNNFLL